MKAGSYWEYPPPPLIKWDGYVRGGAVWASSWDHCSHCLSYERRNIGGPKNYGTCLYQRKPAHWGAFCEYFKAARMHHNYEV